MKGPEVAQWWHDPLTRPYRDLDVLVEDSEATWRTLREAGFQPTGDPELYLGIHHLRPLVWPGLPLVVEVHHQPKWIEDSDAADGGAAAHRGPVGDRNSRACSRSSPHATRSHWRCTRGRTFRSAGSAVSSTSLRSRRAPTATSWCAIACAWDVERLWRTTQTTIDSLFGDRRRPLVGHVWARHLWGVRERTVLERHLEQWLGPFSALPPGQAAASRHAGISRTSSRLRTARRACR